MLLEPRMSRLDGVCGNKMEFLIGDLLGVMGNGIAKSRLRFVGDLEGELGGKGGANDAEALGEIEAKTRVREEGLERVLNLGKSAKGTGGMDGSSECNCI